MQFKFAQVFCFALYVLNIEKQQLRSSASQTKTPTLFPPEPRIVLPVPPFAPDIAINDCVGHVTVTCSVSFEAAEH